RWPEWVVKSETLHHPKLERTLRKQPSPHRGKPPLGRHPQQARRGDFYRNHLAQGGGENLRRLHFDGAGGEQRTPSRRAHKKRWHPPHPPLPIPQNEGTRKLVYFGPGIPRKIYRLA